MVDHDETDVGAGIVCLKLEDIEDGARFAYYAARVLKFILV